MKVVVEADGGSRGNPGPAGYGSVVWTADRSTVLAESKQAIGWATNNVAEYRGLIAGLEEAAYLRATEVAVSMDSKLVVEQMSGRWKVKHADLATAQRHRSSTGVAVRADQLSVDPASRKLARRPIGQRGDGRRGRAGGADRQTGGGGRPRDGRAAGVDRRARRRHQTAAAAPRPDRTVGPTALLRTRQPDADRAGPAAGRRGRALPGQRGGITAVVSSPLQRCYETATAAAKALGLDVAVDDDLIETDFGEWEGLTFSEAADRDPDLHRRWLRDTSTEPPGGESFDHVNERVRQARTGSSPNMTAAPCLWCRT